MSIFGWIIITCIFLWFAHQNDKKMDENFLNSSIRTDFLEKRIEELEISNRYNEESIEHLRTQVRDLNERIYELEKPYQKSIFDDLD